MLCPICKSPVPDPPAGQVRSPYPFCSERCKLVDLGRWLDAKYQIPVAEDDQDAAAGESPLSSNPSSDDD